MTSSNLGIIFGPTLIKPRQADAEVSLSSLVDYPYQALIVELLIRHYEMIFDTPLSPLSPSSPVAESSPLPIKSRFTPKEKEQQLSRHSKSLVDIKEVRQTDILRYCAFNHNQSCYPVGKYIKTQALIVIQIEFRLSQCSHCLVKMDVYLDYQLIW